jgi:hypothetical protein
MPAVGDDAPATFEPLPLIRALNEHGVAFVAVGGYAAGVQGAELLTYDLGIVYASTRENYERLAAVLKAIEAEPVGLPPGVKVTLDARALQAGDLWTLSTRLGRSDLMREPAPGLGYEALSARARTIRGRETYRVASIDDLIIMKRHAGRAKDIGHLEILRAVADVLAEGRH